MTFAANIEGVVYDWPSQERQYAKGPPGITHELHTVACAWVRHEASGRTVAVPSDYPVDCLIYRSNKGNVVGVLNYYAHTNAWEKAGNVNLWVHPRRQRRGIGTALVVEALRRWPIDLAQQNLTSDGAALANALTARGLVPAVTS